MPSNAVTDVLSDVGLFGTPIVCGICASVYALRSGRVDRPGRFVFFCTWLLSIPIAVLVGWLADLYSYYEMSAGVLMVFFEPPFSAIVAALAAGITVHINRQRLRRSERQGRTRER